MRYIATYSDISPEQEIFTAVQKVQALRTHFGIGTLYGWRIFRRIYEDSELSLHPRENCEHQMALEKIEREYERYLQERILPAYVEHTFNYRIL